MTSKGIENGGTPVTFTRTGQAAPSARLYLGCVRSRTRRGHYGDARGN
jgi:hypothetical protein